MLSKVQIENIIREHESKIRSNLQANKNLEGEIKQLKKQLETKFMVIVQGTNSNSVNGPQDIHMVKRGDGTVWTDSAKLFNNMGEVDNYVHEYSRWGTFNHVVLKIQPNGHMEIVQQQNWKD